MKRFLLLVLAAIFVILPFSCSNEGFKQPEGALAAGDSESIPCIVNEQCYQISRHSCGIMGGKWGDTLDPKIESCKNPFVEITDFELYISGDTLYFRGTVEITDSSETLDSVKVKSAAGFPIIYDIVEEGKLIYDFSIKVKPIDLSRADIDCGENNSGRHRISVSIFAGGKPAQIINAEFVKPKVYCKDPYPIDPFTCKWTPGELSYGKRATPSLELNDPNCTKKMYLNDTTLFEEKEYTISTKNGFPKMGEFSIYGVVTCEDPTRRGLLRLPCEVLKIDSVPEPKFAGELSFKSPDYTDEDGKAFYFIGSTVTQANIENNITITNEADVECNPIEIEIEGSPARKDGTITATASVTCGEDETEYELGSISAGVLPDPVVGECSLASGWDSLMYKRIDYKKYEGGRKTSEATKTPGAEGEGESLTINVSVENDYDRCTVEYSLTGRSGSFGANNTIKLSSLSSSSSGKTTLDSITARVTCSGQTTSTRKICPQKITVIEKFAKIEKCDDPRVTIGPGATLLEIDCYGDGNNPPSNLGCDCAEEDYGGCGTGTYACASGTYNNANNFFSLNGKKAEGGGCWATTPLPANTVRDKKRVLVEYYKEIGCVAHF